MQENIEAESVADCSSFTQHHSAVSLINSPKFFRDLNQVNMQWYSAVVLLVLVAVASAAEFYSDKYNGINTHDIIDNERLWKKYYDCILQDETAGCPPEALELKKVLSEALKTVCAKCSPEQQEKTKDTLEYICEKRAAAFAEILKKIDPNNEYRGPFEAKFGKLKGGC